MCVLVLDLTATLYHSTLASLGKVEDSTLHVLNGVRLGVVTTFRPESPDAQSGYRMIEERIRSNSTLFSHAKAKTESLSLSKIDRYFLLMMQD